MRLLSKTKDGGPDSPVDAFFIVEIKSLFSIALLRFNKGGREAFHTHAFNAFTWFLLGDLIEEKINGDTYVYHRSFLPKVTKKNNNHRVTAVETSWCFTIRGPWQKTWTEDIFDKDGNRTTIVLTHGRKIIN